MGFRDLHNFNLAILAKKGWRLLQQQESLVYKCFKAKYFPHGTFLEAMDVPNSSYIWKSLLAAQPILRKGGCWRVGNGSSIRVTRDSWIPNHPTHKVLHPPHVEEWEWRVSDLIDWWVKAWDRELIVDAFHRKDAEAILRIPLSHRLVSDAMIWLHTKSGEYMVRSRYHIAQLIQKQEKDVGESSKLEGGSQVWAKVWKMKVPNKIRVFAWRACQNILPTCENLFHRKVALDAYCERCNQAPESVLHVLWECGAAQDVWAGGPRRLQKVGTEHRDFMQLIEDLILRLSEEELELFWVHCWLIWNHRNMVLHGGKAQDPSRLNSRASDLLDEFKASQVQLAVHTNRVNVQTWCPPSGNLYQLNFDAIVFTDTESSGFGAVIRNNTGAVMAALSVKGPPVSSNEEAEVLACWRALEFAVETGFQEVVVEGDNATVIRGLTTSKPDKSMLGNIYEDARCLALKFRKLSASCVRRSANGVAHSLARFAKFLSKEHVWLEEQHHPHKPLRLCIWMLLFLIN